MLQTKNILIVEDELLIANQLKFILSKNDYSCAGIAINYARAEQILETSKVDLAILDINISGQKSGLDIAQLINEKYGISFIFLTSYNDPDTLSKLKQLKPKAYINKPINEATLITTLDLLFENNLEDKNEFHNVQIGTSIYTINLSDLVYIKTEHVYIRLIFKSRKLLLRSSLTHFLDQMPSDSLIQVNRSIAVNPIFIEAIKPNNLIVDGEELKVSKNYAKNLDILSKN